MPTSASSSSARDSVAPQKIAPKIPIDLFVFDLDGTLIDATDDIVVAVNYTLNKFGHQALSREVIASHVGHGVRNLLEQTFLSNPTKHDESTATFEAALKTMLDYYYEHCLDTTYLYPGVLETLATLKRSGKHLNVCTNKTLRHSEKILDGLGIRAYFTTIVGGNSFPEKKPHPMGLEHILQQARLSPKQGVMVGDSAVDVNVGKRAGLYTCGCSYGLRPRSELEAAAPHVVVDRFEQLLDYFA